MKDEERELNKVFYRIGEVAKIAGLKEYVIRFWEDEFPLLKPVKNKGGHRLFKKNDVEHILMIKKMLYEEGYTIAGAKKVLNKRREIPPGKGFEQTVRDVTRDLEELLKIM